MRKVLFLDIDGVLNNGVINPVSQSCTIDPICVENLNRVIHATECEIVLSSAWRYMCLKVMEWPQAMTLTGFEYLLKTHGVTSKLRITGHLPRDCDEFLGSNRGAQIRDYVRENLLPGDRYAVVDDKDLEIRQNGLPFVQTNPAKGGMTKNDASRLIVLLAGVEMW